MPLPVLLFRRCLPLALAWLILHPAGSSAQDRQVELEFFETHIRPVLVEQCYPCHSVELGKSEGGLLLDSAPALLRGGDSGPALVAGQPDESLLISALRYQLFEMPPSGKLSEETIQLFEQWIQQGARDPRHEEAPSSAPTPEVDFETARQHWAFQPLSSPVVPVGDAAWSRTALDRFISQRHLDSERTPAPEAAREIWLRRVTFDLIGLPPTLSELQDFLVDDRPDAYERVVDRLLASPHYGERWGRLWLDLARYADSNGADENHAYPVAWRYRDYVVAAYNQDKPFDQFMIEQLAGDLLPAEDEAHRRELLTATGFLVLGPKMLAEQDKPKLVADIVDEQIDTVGKVFLGLTLGCARCHDHKYDPIPTQDYYALAGIFHSTKTMEHLNHVSQWNERDLPDAQRARLVEAHQAKIADAKERLEQLKSEPGNSEDWTEEQKSQLEEAQQEVESLEKESPTLDKVMAVDEDTVKLVAVHVRGNHLQHAGEPLPRSVPRALELDGTAELKFPADGSGRLELARWLTNSAAPLTARVIVNRIWQGHFGEGLVRTPSNFGLLGEPPSHPELLDWLAREFIANGWSMKYLHRQMVLSSTYRLSSASDQGAAEHDPANLLWLRFHRRRLEVEPLRDALLVASGELDRSLGGQAQSVYGATFESSGQSRSLFDAARRTIYLPINRASLDDVFATFDYIDPAVSLDKRPSTIVPHQVLFLQNHSLPMHSAWELARRLLQSVDQPHDRMTRAYRTLFSRDPTEQERMIGIEFIQASMQTIAGESADLDSWSGYCRALILTNEFLYVD